MAASSEYVLVQRTHHHVGALSTLVVGILAASSWSSPALSFDSPRPCMYFTTVSSPALIWLLIWPERFETGECKVLESRTHGGGSW